MDLVRYYRQFLAVIDRYTDKDTSVHILQIQIQIWIQKHGVSPLVNILQSGTCKFQEKCGAVLLLGGDLDAVDPWMDPNFVS